jgi:hypothetical protein
MDDSPYQVTVPDETHPLSNVFCFPSFKRARRFAKTRQLPIFFRDAQGRLHECHDIPGQETFL